MKPVLVLVPSLGTTASLFWRGQADVLAERFDLLPVDLPGHGLAPPPDGPVRIEDIAAHVLDLLDERGAERASFCGVSIGGMAGMWLGANAPDRLDGLVLACTGASLGSKEVYDERATLVRAEGTHVVVDGARERWFTPGFRDSERARAILDELARIDPDGYAACCQAVGAFDFHADLGRIAVPTLVVSAEHDPVATHEVADELVVGIPNASWAPIPGGSHLVNVEEPESFNAAVLEFLSERIAA